MMLLKWKLKLGERGQARASLVQERGRGELNQASTSGNPIIGSLSHASGLTYGSELRSDKVEGTARREQRKTPNGKAKKIGGKVAVPGMFQRRWKRGTGGEEKIY